MKYLNYLFRIDQFANYAELAYSTSASSDHDTRTSPTQKPVMLATDDFCQLFSRCPPGTAYRANHRSPTGPWIANELTLKGTFGCRRWA